MRELRVVKNELHLVVQIEGDCACMCVDMCVCVHVCMCACVCAWAQVLMSGLRLVAHISYIHIHTHAYTHS